jgi:two-component system phosphate regulon sensor histidine kinase PhoR
MERKRLFIQLFPWFLFVTLAPIALVLAVTWKVVEDFHLDRTRQELLARVELFRLSIPDLGDNREAIDAICKRAARRERGAGPEVTRFTVMAADGTVLGDSVEEPAVMANHADRSEVKEALTGRVGRSERFSDTQRKLQLYAAVPYRQGEAVVGVVRGSFTVNSVQAVVVRVTFRILVMGLLTALVSVGIGLYASRLMAEPLEEMADRARRLGEGDLKTRMPVQDTLELANLSDALNRMAVLLDERIQRETHQRRERDAVLASMNEGVLAVDMNQTILGINAAGARLLDVEEGRVRGRSILELVRNPELERFLESALKADSDLESDLVLHGRQEVYLQLRGAPLKGDGGKRIGAVIVLSDVTRLHRLEAVRREFVANASHELRTPITAIRGFAETLVEEAGNDPDAVKRFAGIIESHARRLELLVEDMLTLSRLEYLSERESLALECIPVAHVLDAAAAACEARAAARRIRLEVACPEGLMANLASSLMEQAVVNLIDNAVKYSEDGGAVAITADAVDQAVRIRVKDQGCGIEAQHLPRLFERFYRADNARSRKLGGTGLGLAIVKHIVLAHGGSVGVESMPDVGSVFTIRIPLARRT